MSDVAAGQLGQIQIIRRELEEQIQPLALSIDARTFSFMAPIIGNDCSPGTFVTLRDGEREVLGQILSSALGYREVSLSGDASGEVLRSLTGIQLGGSVRVRMIEGAGILLGTITDDRVERSDGDRPFREAPFAPASDEAVASYLAGPRRYGAALAAGRALQADVPLYLQAAGFGKHSFLCGQSGSGKTYALGVILEQLLVQTTLRMVVLDPNSDFVRLGELDHDAAGSVRVFRPAGRGGDGALQVRFADLEPDARARVLGLDPLRDRAEYAALAVVSDHVGERATLGDVAAALRAENTDEAHALGLRIRNLGVAGWSIWSPPDDASSVVDALDEGHRAVVADLGTCESAAERAVAAHAVLAGLWARRERREAVLVVIDEAHNVCPHGGVGVLDLATDLAVRIAGEGRKYGLYLLVATQRPAKVHENVLSQCENLVLLRMASAADLHHVQTLFSHVPTGLLERATGFRQGEAVVAGRIVEQALLAQFGGRRSPQGGVDVPTTWADRTD